MSLSLNNQPFNFSRIIVVKLPYSLDKMKIIIYTSTSLNAKNDLHLKEMCDLKGDFYGAYCAYLYISLNSKVGWSSSKALLTLFFFLGPTIF